MNRKFPAVQQNRQNVILFNDTIPLKPGHRLCNIGLFTLLGDEKQSYQPKKED
jgi:hypothetical protein